MDLLRGPAHRQRPPRPAPRVGPGVQGPLPPLPDHARPPRAPQGRLGLPRPAGRARGREGARALHQARDRGVRHRRVQPALPRVGAPLRRRLGGAHRPRRASGSTPPTPTGPSTTTTSSRCGGCVRQIWDKGLLYEGHKVVALLRPLRHRAVVPRGRPARVYRDVVDPSVYVRFPRRRPAADADLLVWTTTPWTLISNVAAAVGPDIDYVRVTTTDGGRDLVMAAAARSRGRRASSATLHGRRPRRLALRAAVHLPRAAARRRRLAGRRRRLRHHRRRLRHRPPRPGLRRGRRRRRPGRGPARAQPGRRRRRFDETVPPYTGRFVKDADRDIIDDLAARGLLVARAGLRAQLPALLALRHAAHLLGQDLVVRAHLRAARRAARARTRRSAGTPSTSSTAASASGSRATSTGRCPATATGARRCRSGAATSAGHDTASARSPSWRELAGRDLTELDLHRPTSTTSPSPAPPTAAPAPWRASPRCSTPGSTPARCRRPSTTTRSRTATASTSAVPRRLHLRGHRPDPRLVLLPARRQLPGVRLDAVPQRGLPGPSSTRTARRCRSHGAT